MPEEINGAESFGRRLRGLRGPLTQHALARRSAVGSEALTRQRVSYIENGQLPTAGQLRCYLHGCGRVDQFDELDAIRRQLDESGRETIPPEAATPWSRWRFVVINAAIVLAAAAVVTATVFNRPPPPAVGECAPNYVCFWPEPNFGGNKIQWDPVWASENHCTALPFEARSEMNSSKERQLGFAGQDCTGPHTVLNHLGGSERSISARAYKHS